MPYLLAFVKGWEVNCRLMNEDRRDGDESAVVVADSLGPMIQKKAQRDGNLLSGFRRGTSRFAILFSTVPFPLCALSSAG